MAQKTSTIKQVVLIPAEPKAVYAALTDAKKHTAFTGAKATGGAKVGEKITAQDGYITGKVLELEKDKRIVQEWKTTEWPDDAEPSKLEISLKKKGSGTELTMVHSKVPSDQAESYKGGWIEFYWDPMKKYFGKK
jgi:activator of HSP90 ATPase